MTDFPTLEVGLDASTFKASAENPSLNSAETEGGYSLTRARFTRKPRRTFSFSYSNLSNSDVTLLTDFFDDRFGGAEAFNWTHPATGVVYNVRFASDFSLEFSVVIAGRVSSENRWATNEIILKEV